MWHNFENTEDGFEEDDGFKELKITLIIMIMRMMLTRMMMIRLMMIGMMIKMIIIMIVILLTILEVWNWYLF